MTTWQRSGSCINPVFGDTATRQRVCYGCNSSSYNIVTWLRSGASLIQEIGGVRRCCKSSGSSRHRITARRYFTPTIRVTLFSAAESPDGPSGRTRYGRLILPTFQGRVVRTFKCLSDEVIQTFMEFMSEQVVCCPYCGESIHVLIDHEEAGDQYIEDCQVCCKPINFTVSVDSLGHLSVSVRDENEAF